MKELKANRVPPGDRWAMVDGDDQIYSSLTELLNQPKPGAKMTRIMRSVKTGLISTIVSSLLCQKGQVL